MDQIPLDPFNRGSLLERFWNVESLDRISRRSCDDHFLMRRIQRHYSTRLSRLQRSWDSYDGLSRLSGSRDTPDFEVASAVTDQPLLWRIDRSASCSTHDRSRLGIS